MPADWAAQLDFILHLRDVMHVRRNLAVIEPFNRELEFFGLVGSGRGSDRVAALGAITVRRSQSHQNVLTGPKRNGLRKTKEEAFHAR